MFIHFVHDLQAVDIHRLLPGEPLRVVFAVTDQFAREHRTPPLLFSLWIDTAAHNAIVARGNAE
jgi:hypothetical protein